MQIRKPTKEHYSHPMLNVCFSFKLVKLLKELKILKEDFEKDLSNIKEYVYNEFDYNIKTKKIKNSFYENLSEIDSMYDYKWEDFFYKYEFDSKCENCRKKLTENSAYNKAHIIKRTFFNYSTGIKIYEDTRFERHMANILILCANCHDEMEKKGVSPKKSMINRRIRWKNKMLENLENDIDTLIDFQIDIDEFRKELEEYKKEFKDTMYDIIADYFDKK